MLLSGLNPFISHRFPHPRSCLCKCLRLFSCNLCWSEEDPRIGRTEAARMLGATSLGTTQPMMGSIPTFRWGNSTQRCSWTVSQLLRGRDPTCPQQWLAHQSTMQGAPCLLASLPHSFMGLPGNISVQMECSHSCPGCASGTIQRQTSVPPFLEDCLPMASTAGVFN